MMHNNEAAIVSKPAFIGVGLRWEGTFAEAGAGKIRVIHSELQRRLSEIRHVRETDSYYGLSFNATPGAPGFVHYCVVEVDQADNVPDGMVEISVGVNLYAKCEHRKGQSIDQSYQNIFKWIEEKGYKEATDNLTHFEIYPISQDPYSDDPEFTIMIPVHDQNDIEH